MLGAMCVPPLFLSGACPGPLSPPRLGRTHTCPAATLVTVLLGLPQSSLPEIDGSIPEACRSQSKAQTRSQKPQMLWHSLTSF